MNLVEAGEQAGALETLLDKIATYKEKTEALKKKIKKALFYPAAVLVVAVIVTVILLIFVIPQFETLFKGFGADLPAFTQMVIDMSRFVQDQGWLLAIVTGGGIYAFLQARSARAHCARPSTASRSNFRSSARSSTRPPSRATRARCRPCSAPACRWSRRSNPWPAPPATSCTRTPCCACATRSPPASACSAPWKTRGLFPNMVVQMIAVGEESGSLDEMSGKVADFYEDDVDNAVDSMSSLLEPLIMAILGVLVGGLVIAMYLPIFKLGAVI